MLSAHDQHRAIGEQRRRVVETRSLKAAGVLPLKGSSSARSHRCKADRKRYQQEDNRSLQTRRGCLSNYRGDELNKSFLGHWLWVEDLKWQRKLQEGRARSYPEPLCLAHPKQSRASLSICKWLSLAWRVVSVNSQLVGGAHELPEGLLYFWSKRFCSIKRSNRSGTWMTAQRLCSIYAKLCIKYGLSVRIPLGVAAVSRTIEKARLRVRVRWDNLKRDAGHVLPIGI